MMMKANGTNAKPIAFSFGQPLPVLDRADISSYYESVLLSEKYYTPPISFDGLAKSYRANPHHSSAISVKKNVLLSTCQTAPCLSVFELEKFILDYLIFGNAYLSVIKNRFGQPLKISAPKAKYIRPGAKEGQYFYIVRNAYQQEYEFELDSVFHFKAPEINQDVYGLPDYLSALQSVWLNEEATLFRRKYYANGAHAGCILYLNDTVANEEDITNLREQLKGAKGPGNFKNLFVYAPNGKKDGLQILPFAQVAAKDEFLAIKNASRDDVLAAHRVPPQLMSIIPNNTGGFGDVEKAAAVFFTNEIKPLQLRLSELNAWLGKEVIRFEQYELLKS